MTHYTIGIDISKDNFEAHRLPDGAAKQFSNNAAGFRNLLSWIGGCQIERLVYEPTGSYHLEFECAMDKAGLPLVKVNPLQAKRFAQAVGTKAKTDRVDAHMLAKMGMVLSPPCGVTPSENLRKLKGLHIARRALIKDRTAAKNRSHTITQKLLLKQNKARLQQIKRDLEAIEAEMLTMIESNETTKQALKIIGSIPGIGKLTAIALLVEMPELGMLDNKAVASLAGLAPITRQSGKWQGKAFINGGRKIVRDALYMPALVAIRYNPDMKTKYQSLIQIGKPPKVAITAVMRKLIILANTLIKKNTEWVNFNA